ncbi:DUF4129 domain-containing protein [Nocardia arizonensis]|uniref:DUF4129 domain-containing protein n=1 Tax=Nocardia arizonensis TaxID=1141647 RepID=UPI0006CFC55C|nr:DUF4129 domain-containing protein [Nocardia arizonensis]
MSEEFDRAPDPAATPRPPRLGPAAEHRAAADDALRDRDFDRALRERFRAMLRGLEQGGLLEVRRSRTADETVDDVSTALPHDLASELQPTARSFDEVVYGGRRATEDEYRRLEYADRFSDSAPPPAAEPTETAPVETVERRKRALPPLPPLLRNPKFWAVLIGSIVLILLIWVLIKALGAPTAPPAPKNPPPSPDGDDGDSGPIFGSGRDSIFERLPAPIAFGGLQFLVAAALLVWWRARRRGALVGEPRPVEVAANELLAGQAALYRKAGDPGFVAAKLRASTLRRIRPTLGVAADATPDHIVAAVAGRTGLDPAAVAAALYGPVPDANALRQVATRLDWIEAQR